MSQTELQETQPLPDVLEETNQESPESSEDEDSIETATAKHWDEWHRKASRSQHDLALRAIDTMEDKLRIARVALKAFPETMELCDQTMWRRELWTEQAKTALESFTRELDDLLFVGVHRRRAAKFRKYKLMADELPSFKRSRIDLEEKEEELTPETVE